MTIYRQSLLQRDPRRQQQIRLLELIPGSPCDQIRCNLRYEDLNLTSSSLITYDALSYCWGKKTNKKPIVVDDSARLWVTTNLHSALYHIRRTEGPRLLWVDAICINQEDTAEKNQQVALMRQIYSAAQSVLIWLGEESHNSRAALKLAQDILRAERLDQAHGISSRNLRDLNDDHWGLPLTTNPIWYDLFGLIRRPWFRRAWIIQELAVSDDATIICGFDEISWKDFGATFAYLAACGLTTTFAPVALANFYTLNHACQLVKQASEQQALHVLMRHRQNLATNPRDKIFAFSGLVTAQITGASILRPDYDVPVADLYVRFAVETLRNEGSLKILSVPHVQQNSRIDHLPSWVPDWSVSDQAVTLEYWENDEKIEGLIRQDFTATGSSKCSPRFDEAYTRLGLQGAVIDRILLAAPEFSNYPDRRNLIHTNDLKVMIRDQKTLKRWETIAQCRIPWVNYPTGEKIMDVYWQTLLAGTIWVNYEGTKRMFDSWDQASRLFRTLQFFCLDRPWFFEFMAKIISGICFVASKFGWNGVINSIINFAPEKPLFREIATPMLDRRLFRTQEGFIGLGPKLMREDEDYVALCEGGALPLVVRPKGDDWEVVGDCYIHGITRGEAYELVKDEVKTMWFV